MRRLHIVKRVILHYQPTMHTEKEHKRDVESALCSSYRYLKVILPRRLMVQLYPCVMTLNFNNPQWQTQQGDEKLG